VFPNMVNLVVLNGHLLVSNPHGPIVDGVDQFQTAFRRAVAETGHRVHFVTDTQYHKWSGNAHCATNVQREGFAPSWWSFRGAQVSGAN